MRKPVLALIALAAVLIVAALAQAPAYVGAGKCALCHKTETQGRQHPIWTESKHSQSLAALSRPEVVAKAKDAGKPVPSENPDCLKCHAPLADKAPELKAEGVTCEFCHGPGSEYKALKVMKDRTAAAEKGLILFPTPEAKKAQCLKCHESAHDKTFDFDAYWAKIKHPIPAK